MNINEFIKTERENRGWNRKQLAGHSGVSFNTIKSIEDRNQSGNFDTIDRIIGALGYEIILMKKSN